MSLENDGVLVKGEAIESDDEENLNSISKKSRNVSNSAVYFGLKQIMRDYFV